MEIPGLEPKTRGARPPARGRGGRQEQRPRYGR